ITYGSFLVGALALAGIFPLSGFWSKDLIVATAYGVSFAWGVLVSLVSFLTAYYIFREGFVMFHGGERQEEEPHESPSVMVVPMVVLGVMAVVAGFFEGWYGKAFGVHKELHIDIAVLSVVVGLAGILVAYLVYVRGVIDPERAYQSLKPLHTTFKEQFFTERLYHKVLAAGYLFYSRILYATAERQLIDGAVNSTYTLLRGFGGFLRVLQRGRINLYILFLFVGFLLLLALTIMWR
ncbi:MAG: NADH-quinone oxidoreductase subunit L, partial [Aquificaceae bacterium]